MIRIQSEAFDAGGALNAFMKGRTNKGALVCFTGYVRDYASDGDVSELILEHYPDYTEAELAKISKSAQKRWPETESLIIHRYGKLGAGEAIVLVAVCAPHRLAAFDAAQFLMDYLKTEAPFWKKEIMPNGESRWIEPREEDYKARKTWDDRNAD